MKLAEQEKTLYSSRKKLRDGEDMIGQLQWELDATRDETKALMSFKSKMRMK